MTPTVFSFQSQLVSIMDALSKTAVLEISKLVEIESKMLKIEITRGRNEIASLKEKLELMEKLLYMAQRRGQEAAGRRDGPPSSCGGLLQHDATRLTFKIESGWENSATDTSSSQQNEVHALDELQNQPKEQPEITVIKEEPSEEDIGVNGTRGDRTSENRSEMRVTDSQKTSPIVIHSPNPAPEQQQTVFTGGFVTLSKPSSIAGSGRREPHWSPQLSHAHTNPEAGKITSQNAASQSVPRNVKIHNLRSSAAKRFGCLQCGKSFRCFSQLEIHQRSHTGEKPFRCTLCGKRYAQKGHLYTHQRTHTGEKPYRCPVCGKGFIQKCTLDMHQRTHTGEKPFVCTKCGKGFTKNCNLKKHLAVHMESSLHMFGNEPTVPTFIGTFINGATSNMVSSQL
ncbi:zinc finger and SCAN domain-containing protein 2-like [Thalassophryne amazonica]|uniref:zinc finger and SCAN domain-containing protein 2-like n=1 Tax=Thalassophryne amazonica TaxID=390379 RepID=UPI001470BB35|nr:zinc finger and SCAN domain-containing protein 2-like [Thalassophryne amazonica]